MNITYRMLPLIEWDRLKPLYTKLFPDRPFPGPEMSSVAVAEADGEIIGFWFLQLCAHAEPVGLDPSFRGGQVELDELRNTLHKAYAETAQGLEYYICAPTPEWGEVFERRGFWPMGILYGSRIPYKEDN